MRADVALGVAPARGTAQHVPALPARTPALSDDDRDAGHSRDSVQSRDPLPAPASQADLSEAPLHSRRQRSHVHHRRACDVRFASC
jgi:hypothetical protein